MRTNPRSRKGPNPRRSVQPNRPFPQWRRRLRLTPLPLNRRKHKRVPLHGCPSGRRSRAVYGQPPRLLQPHCCRLPRGQVRALPPFRLLLQRLRRQRLHRPRRWTSRHTRRRPPRGSHLRLPVRCRPRVRAPDRSYPDLVRLSRQDCRRPPRPRALPSRDHLPASGRLLRRGPPRLILSSRAPPDR
jgi:hypothetical protein